MDKLRARILCVEDHPDTCSMIQTLLELEDYQVVSASTLQEAELLLQQKEFDLYILDRRLPDGDGIDLCPKLRQADPDASIIFYSAMAFTADRKVGLAAGANAYVAKPAIDQLVSTIGSLLKET